jgi:hypothetical protein
VYANEEDGKLIFGILGGTLWKQQEL